MHLAEGIVPPSTLVVGAALATAGTMAGLRKLNDETVVRVAVTSSALFVASLIHIPAGPVPVHLVLNGLAGIILGWSIFPAYLTALIMQAVFFGYGGITTLGVNTIVMASPGLLCHWLFAGRLRSATGRGAFVIGAATGALAVLGSCTLLCLALVTAGRGFPVVAAIVFGAHVPVAAIEAIVTGSVVSFLTKVRPETFAQAAALEIEAS